MEPQGGFFLLLFGSGRVVVGCDLQKDFFRQSEPFQGVHQSNNCGVREQVREPVLIHVVVIDVFCQADALASIDVQDTLDRR